VKGPEILHLIRHDLQGAVARQGKPLTPRPMDASPWVAMSAMQKAVRRAREDLALSAAAKIDFTTFRMCSYLHDVAIGRQSKRKHCVVILVWGGLARAILLLAARDNSQHIVRQWSLQFEGLRRISQQPQIDLLRRCQDDRHRLGMDRGDNSVRLCGEKAEQLMLPIHWRALWPPHAAPRGP
jgi:hypothetical protein